MTLWKKENTITKILRFVAVRSSSVWVRVCQRTAEGDGTLPSLHPGQQMCKGCSSGAGSFYKCCCQMAPQLWRCRYGNLCGRRGKTEGHVRRSGAKISILLCISTEIATMLAKCNPGSHLCPYHSSYFSGNKGY